MASEPMVPAMVYTLWWVTIALALVVFVPLAVYSLATLLRTTNSIRSYAREGLQAARQIEQNTAVLPALDGTITVATEILGAAEQVAGKLGTIATVLEQRAERLGR